MMTDKQKSKRNFRQSKEWKSFRKFMHKLSGGKDCITNKPLRKGYQVHHQDLDERNYNNLDPAHFICCNNLTHKVIHWLYTYYQKDPKIIDRLREELETMLKINKGAKDGFEDGNFD